MKHAHQKSGSRRSTTSVSLQADLVQEARLETLVREARAAQWKKDNQRAIAAYARYFEKHGIWNEESRG